MESFGEYKAFFQIFCRNCGWSIELNEQQQGSCDNPRCPERHVLIHLSFKILKIRPISDEFHRPKNAPLRPV